MPIVMRAGSSDLPVLAIPFAAEADLQTLLAGSPQLLMQDGDVPLALVDREVDLREAGFLDLLFVSADGLPVAVEAKREANAQARREVVAQVIDYLSALTELTVDELDERVSGKLEVALRTFSASEADDAAFERRWRAVGANLRAGFARMVVAVDGAPSGLERILRFLARNSSLNVQLVTVQRHRAANMGEVSVSSFLVSAASDESHPESSPSRTPRPELIAAVEAYNSAAPPDLRAVGTAWNYRQVRPPEWPTGFRTHYEFYETKSSIGAELHLEADAARPAAEVLSPLAGRPVAGGATSLLWDANWSDRRGRLAAQFPVDTAPDIVATAMRDLIALTCGPVAARLQALQQSRNTAGRAG